MRNVMMKKTAGPGDCFRACLASLLHCDLEEVPPLEEINTKKQGERYSQWYLALQNWLKRKYGLFFLEILLPKEQAFFPQPHGPYCILMGQTVQGFKHAVVGKVLHDEFLVLHNPSPRAEILSVESIAFLVPLNPAKWIPFKMIPNGELNA